MFIRVRRRQHGQRVYDYLDIVENQRIDGKIVRTTLGCLGRRDQLSPHKIDGLIEHLRKLASPEGRRGLRLGEVRMRRALEYGPVLVARRLWEELGLDRLLAGLPHPACVDVEEAVFRMVANRLCDPSSKLGLVDWVDDKGVLHRGWQGRVEWPSGKGKFDYHHYLRAMDCLHPHRQAMEDQIFTRVTELFSLPLNLILYDLTSSYFEGDGVCELAEFGKSRDHRDDRRQLVLGLAVTQEGLPIMQRLFPGNTADVTTLAPVAEELKARFGLSQPMLVADRGMFSDENVARLEQGDFRYLLALRNRSDEEAQTAVAQAFKQGLPLPKAPKALPTQTKGRTEYSFQEVKVVAGARHLVVYSAHKALHDFEVRERRLERTRDALAGLREQASQQKYSKETLIRRATRILVENKTSQYFSYVANKSSFIFWLRRDAYRKQRRHDGLFVLRTNHPGLSPREILDAYLQLQEIERCFRLIKSVIKVRPMYHHRQRRVESHVFLTQLAFLLAKCLEQKLHQASLEGSTTWALEHLADLQAIEHTWEVEAIVAQLTEVSPDIEAILKAVGIQIRNPVLRVSRPQAA